MSFQDSVINEIADMTTTKEPLWKFVIHYPVAYCDEERDNMVLRIQKHTLILDYETFKMGFWDTCKNTPTEGWRLLTTTNQTDFSSKTFHFIHKEVNECEYTDIDYAEIEIVSRTLLN